MPPKDPSIQHAETERRLARLEKIIIDGNGVKPLISLVPMMEKQIQMMESQSEQLKQWLISVKDYGPRIHLAESKIADLEKNNDESREDSRTHYSGLWNVLSGFVGAIAGAVATYFFMVR